MNLNCFPMVRSAKPFLRWWWFSGELEYLEIEEQLNWIKEKGFGGVEIAWVFPLAGAKAGQGPFFLDESWFSYVSFAQDQCKKRELGCDLTFGTLWPFGGNFLPEEYSSRTFNGFSSQRLNRSWESRYSEEPGRILNHLDSKAFSFYADFLLTHGFKTLCEQGPVSFFSDSWEVEVEGLSYGGIFKDFFRKFGYSLEPYLAMLNVDQAIRFDYRKCIADQILEQFYQPYVDMCKKNGASSRMQCHGTPTDILAAYALVDIPETETMLFDPDFALIAASAAAIWNKPVVSSETFSCLYGWVPNTEVPPGLGKEKIEDLKCVADAQFAWGVNRVVWHGMPYSSKKNPHHFYATVHLGPDGTLNGSLSAFNRYLEEMGTYLARGKTFSKMAVYLPLEDQWMLDELPPELVKPSSHYYWELQELHMPDELLSYRPLWFSGKWLEKIHFNGMTLQCGDQDFSVFYCDAEWMSLDSLAVLEKLANQGAPIYFKKFPKEPGQVKHQAYEPLLASLKAHSMKVLDVITPILDSEIPLDFWCRKEGDCYYLFISNPAMRKLRYPIPYGFSASCKGYELWADFHSPNQIYHLPLSFAKLDSLLYKIDDFSKTVELIDTEWRTPEK
ncbi:glycosyl hydrolase [uncultured Sphaerochaeta sp.]|uniref:glycosyl hydrolase n=1 Tax=uncultured Sphaerochaeta sp. TaxID=886478 RepID=UPI002A0A683B|nr:glycosyl hydrolase [uncultured Sphaerochaeta sp.]